MIRLLILTLFLTGCATRGDVVSVKWIRPASHDELKTLCDPLELVIGCQWYERGTCIVVSMDYAGPDLETLGHEVKHCFDGKWHQ